jgi:hypothetical protein
MPLIPDIWRWKQEDHKFEASPGKVSEKQNKIKFPPISGFPDSNKASLTVGSRNTLVTSLERPPRITLHFVVLSKWVIAHWKWQQCTIGSMGVGPDGVGSRPRCPMMSCVTMDKWTNRLMPQVSLL